MWTMELPVINSGHLSPESIGFLSSKAGAKFFGIVACYPPMGFFVFCEDAPSYEGFEDLPEDLRALLLWATEEDYSWLRFDADSGDYFDDFPKYGRTYL
jgi:hypothetical protein